MIGAAMLVGVVAASLVAWQSALGVAKAFFDGAGYAFTHIISLTPFRRLLKDYFMICESYYSAIRTASPSQIEAIDMGRRGLHNEGSEMLRERLADKVTIDLNTARRLFTLVCVLHIRG